MMEILGQTIRFGIVGLVNTAIGLIAIYATMFFFRGNPAAANAVGYAMGLTLSFVLNRSWTFGSKRPFFHLLPKFLVVVAISYLLNLSAVLAAIAYWSINPYLAQAAGVAVYTGCVFLGCRRFVFATPRPA
jgi:putative flippase GtrA